MTKVKRKVLSLCYYLLGVDIDFKFKCESKYCFGRYEWRGSEGELICEECYRKSLANHNEL